MSGDETKQLDAKCDECESKYFADSSIYRAICAECAHLIYGWPPCEHRFVDGRCQICGWDGSRSPYILSLIRDRRDGADSAD